MLNIKKIDHIAIVTNNIQKSIIFFANLGLKCKKIETLLNRGIKVAFINIGNIEIELISSIYDNSEISDFLKHKGPGLHHIAFETTNILSDTYNLQNYGIKLVLDKPQKGAANSKINFIHPQSSGKVLIELLEK